MKRALLISPLLLVLVVLLALAWLLMTESGLRWALAQAQARLPAQLEVAKASGTLGERLQLDGIRYRDGELEFEADRLVFEWHLAALFSGRLEINRIELSSAALELPQAAGEAADASEQTAPVDVELPLEISLQSLSVDAFAFRQGENSFRLRDFEMSASAHEQSLAIDPLRLAITDILIAGQAQQDVELRLAGNTGIGAPFTHDLELEWRTQLPNGAPLENRTRLTGDLDKTRLQHRSTGPLQADLTLDLLEPLQALRWQGELALAQIDTAALDPAMPGFRGNARLNAGGDLQAAKIDGELGGQSDDLGDFSTRFSLQTLSDQQPFDGLQIDRFELDYLEGLIETRGRVHWSPALSWQAEVEITGVNPEALAPEWPGEISARLRSDGRLEGESVLTANAEIFESSGRLRGYPVELSGKLQYQDGSLLIEDANLGSGSSTATVSGRVGDALELAWSVTSPDLAEVYPDAAGSLRAQGRLGGTAAAPLIEATFEGKSLQFLANRVRRISGNTEIDLQNWQAMRLELTASDMEILGQSLETLEMVADNNAIEANLLAEDLAAELRLDGEFREQSWQGKLERLKLDSADYGDWQLEQAVALSLSAQSISAERLCLVADSAAEICLALEQNGADWDIDANVAALPLGLLQGFAPENLELDGKLEARAELTLRQGNELLGDVSVDLPQASASYPLQADKIERFDFRESGLELALEPGGISARATLMLDNGDKLESTVELPAARALAIDPAQQDLRGSAVISIRNWLIVDALLPEISDLRGELGVDLDVSGKLADPSIEGKARLQNGNLNLDALGLTLAQVEIDVVSDGSDRLDFEAGAEIAGGRVKFTGDTVLDRQQGWPSRIKLSADDLSIGQLLAPWVVEALTIDGQLAAAGEIEYRAPDQLTGKIEVSAPEGALNYPLLEQEVERWDFRDGLLSITLAETGVDASGNIAIGDRSSISTEIALPGARLLSLDPGQQRIEASANVDFDELELVEFIVPEVDQIKGRLTLSMRASGRLGQPEIKAEANMAGASFRVPRLGLEVKEIELKGESDDLNRFDFTLNALSGEGNLAISGRSTLDPARGWPTEISVKGSDFEVSRIPEAQVTISPDLQISMVERTLDITGKLHLPFAKLQPKDISSTARVSNDTVIIGSEQAPEEKWQVTTRVNLTLGEQVSFIGFGFEGSLGGGLEVVDVPGQLSLGNGEILIREGRYRAYGQRLEIKDGRLLFAGSPLDNPGLDLRATREVDDVTVGLQVRGRLQKPELELFSNPSLSQTEMLSYLLLGRPLDNTSGSDGEMMARAALALGIAGGDTIARQLGDRFGLDEVRVESSDGGDQASLVVGRYLSPDLYVSYGVGLIESINTLNLRYRMTERWQIEAESGEYQGADLLFSIER